MKKVSIISALSGAAIFALGTAFINMKDNRFQVSSTHTKEECLKHLQETKASKNDLLDKFVWGCEFGDHTGYAVIEGDNNEAVKKMLPTPMAGKAKIQQVKKYSAEEIEGFHSAKK